MAARGGTRCIQGFRFDASMPVSLLPTWLATPASLAKILLHSTHDVLSADVCVDPKVQVLRFPVHSNSRHGYLYFCTNNCSRPDYMQLRTGSEYFGMYLSLAV